MNLEQMLRLIAGAVVVATTALGMWVHPGFLWVTLFAGANLLQSAVTDWCPMMAILRRVGVKG